MRNNETNRPGKGILTREIKRSPQSRDLNLIIDLVRQDNQTVFERIGGRRLRPEHRAVQDLDDLIQSTLFALFEAMSSGAAVFASREEIRHWIAKSAKWTAIAMYKKAVPMMRQDTLLPAVPDGSPDGFTAFLDLLISQRGHGQITADIQMMDDEIQVLAKRLLARVNESLADRAKLTEADCEVIDSWLDGEAFKAIAAQHKSSIHGVRQLTYDFKTSGEKGADGESIGSLIKALREEIGGVEMLRAGVLGRLDLTVETPVEGSPIDGQVAGALERLDLSGRCLRLLGDFRLRA